MVTEHDIRCELAAGRLYRRTDPATPTCHCQDRAAGYTTWSPGTGYSSVTFGDDTGPAPWEWETLERTGP